MKMIVACEVSGIVAKAFRDQGHEAWSCDLRPSEKSEWHIQGDVRDWLNRGGCDLMIGHPPCTHLALSGARWCTDHWVKLKNKPARWHDGSEKRKSRDEAIEFFKLLWESNIPSICLEQPMSIASTRVAPKTQTIHPWQFGHGEVKTTWLWLKNLPLLRPTNIVEGRDDRIHRMPPGKDREKNRSRTYQGIADAMADQWGAMNVTK